VRSWTVATPNLTQAPSSVSRRARRSAAAALAAYFDDVTLKNQAPVSRKRSGLARRRWQLASAGVRA
jgi:hypothetical protein